MTVAVGEWGEVRRLLRGALSETECVVLAEHAAATDAAWALEIGHYTGLSSVVLLESLPVACGLVTIDHHRGDQWSSKTSVAKYEDSVRPHIRGRDFIFLNGDMRDELPRLHPEPLYGFVFYDADHSRQGVEDFWTLTAPLLANHCVLTFDDADWEEQSTLIGLAEAAGFVSIRDRDFYRGKDDKRNPDTYSLEVMRRG